MPITYRERDELITKLKADGISYNRIAIKFELSAQRIRQIVYRKKQLLLSLSNADEFIKKIQHIDDTTINLNTIELIDKLNFSSRASKCLHNYFSKLNSVNINLEEFSNCIIVDCDNSTDDLFSIVPLYREYQVGRKTVSSIVMHLYNLDLGKNFNTLWRYKVNKLINFFISRGKSLPLAFRDIKSAKIKS